MARMAAISSGERASGSQRRLAVPMPCSALIDAAPVGDEPEDGVVHRLVARFDAGDVDVDVAVGGVAEQPRAGAGRHAPHDLDHLAEERGEGRPGAASRRACGAGRAS